MKRQRKRYAIVTIGTKENPKQVFTLPETFNWWNVFWCKMCGLPIIEYKKGRKGEA